MILFNDCLRHYSSSMEKALENVDPYLADNDIQALHENTKNEAVAMVRIDFDCFGLVLQLNLSCSTA